MATSSLIGDQYLPQIQDALAKLDLAEKELELARRAGLNTLPGGAQLDTLATQVSTARSALMGIKQVYFPNS